MRRTGLIILLTLISMSALAQSDDDRLKREIDAREAEVSSILDTVSVTIFNEDYITGTLWKNDFADMMKVLSEMQIPMDTSGWEDVLAWLLPDNEKDVARLSVASEEGISINVQDAGDVYGKYIQRFRSHGFSYDVNVTKMYGVKMFEARNDKGDRQCAVVDMGDGNYSVSVEKAVSDAEMQAEFKNRTGEAQREAKEAEYEELMKKFL